MARSERNALRTLGPCAARHWSARAGRTARSR
jgi:hypothetical protein